MRSALAAILRNLVIPFGAKSTDSAVILEGQPEAILLASDQTAVVIWQYSPDGTSRRGFLAGVEADPGIGGELHFFATDFAAPLFKRQFIDLFHNEDGSGQLALATQTAPLTLTWSAGGTGGIIDLGSSGTTLLTLTADALTLNGQAFYVGPEAFVSQAAMTAGSDTCAPDGVIRNMAGTGSVTSVALTKAKAGTRVKLRLMWTGFATSTTTNINLFVRINGVDYPVGGLSSAIGADRLDYYGEAMVPAGLAAGTYTVQARWSSTGTGTATRNAADWLLVSAQEVA